MGLSLLLPVRGWRTRCSLWLPVSSARPGAEVLYNFDCSCVQFGMTESMEILATPEALLFTPYMLNV
jgi:hypothetical protein